VEKGESRLSMTVTGNLVEDQSSPVTVTSGGRVVSTRATVGNYAHQGDELMRIDAIQYESRLQQARASEAQALYTMRQSESSIFQEPGKPFNPEMQPSVVTAKDQFEGAKEQNEIAKRQLERYQQLLKTGDVSSVSVDQIRQQATSARSSLASAFIQYEGQLRGAKNSFESAAVSRENYKASQAATKVAQENLDACTLRSPVSGYVLSRQYSAGDWASTGTVAVTVIKVNPILLNARVPEGREHLARTGFSATVRVPSFPNKTFTGVIRNISPALDVNSRALIATISIPNQTGDLRPGMFGTADIQIEGTESALWVPAGSIVPGVTASAPIVFVLDDELARARVVRVGEESMGRRRVYSGLTPNDRVIVNGARELFDGAQVRLN